jgi:hypothetical protein
VQRLFWFRVPVCTKITPENRILVQRPLGPTPLGVAALAFVGSSVKRGQGATSLTALVFAGIVTIRATHEGLPGEEENSVSQENKAGAQRRKENKKQHG